MVLANKMRELYAFLSKWESELRKELQLASKPGGSVGISFDSTVHLRMAPLFPMIPMGTYISKTMEHLMVEVTAQEEGTGLLTIDMVTPGISIMPFQVMTADLFNQLFTKVIPPELDKGLPVDS